MSDKVQDKMGVLENIKEKISRKKKALRLPVVKINSRNRPLRTRETNMHKTGNRRRETVIGDLLPVNGKW